MLPCIVRYPASLKKNLVVQAQLSAVATSAQQGVASVLGSIQHTLAPKADEKQDPEVQDFR
jgi:hypothetical protein